MTSRLVTGCLAALLIASTASAQPTAERLDLATAVRMAVAHNTRVRSALLDVQKADAELQSARTRRLPSFDAEVNASQLLTPVSIRFPRGAFGDYPAIGPVPGTDTTVSASRQPTAYVSTQVSQPLTPQVRIGLGIQSAAVTLDVQQERLRAQRVAVVAAVKRAYFGVLQTRSALTANDQAIALYRELDRTLQTRVVQKVALRSDVLDVQLRLAQAELTRTTYQNTLASQKEELNQLLGRDVLVGVEPEDVPDLPPLDAAAGDGAAAQARALASRPDVREARLLVQRAELDRRLTSAARLPDVSLALSYSSNVNVDLLPANLASLGVQVKWEPFDWGRRKRDLEVKTHAVAQARLGVRDAEDRAVIDVNRRLRAQAEARAHLLVARSAQRAALEKLRVTTNQFQVQAALLPDVLQRRADVAATDDEYQRALLAFWTATADVDQAVGEDVVP